MYYTRLNTLLYPILAVQVNRATVISVATAKADVFRKNGINVGREFAKIR
jgi:hypothetical protein